MNRKWVKLFAISLLVVLMISGCTSNNGNNTPKEPVTDGKGNVAPEGKPATWIADRKIKGLVFMGSDDYTEDMNPEVKAKVKELTGIDYEIQIMKADHSIDGLIAGLASGDLPDFIAFYLNDSGRPEMPVILKAAREGMFTDLAPLMKDTKVYSKYLEKGFLPLDTEFGVMFRPEFKGATYFEHMNINREGGQTTNMVGGPFIRKDIAEALNVDPRTITSTEQIYELAKKIKAGNFKDSNGKVVTPIGPAYWGGSEVGALFQDLEWGNTEQWIKQDKDGNILHEAETPYAMKKVDFVKKLLSEKLMQPEFFTIDESRATEGAVNGSWAIVGNMHSMQDFNQDVHYLPIGPIKDVDGSTQMKLSFKSGYSGWAIPTTTEKPEDIMKFADFLASKEGKLLWKYGIEGRDYTLDADGKPVVKQEVIDLKAKDPNEAKKLGFAGVGNEWGGILGSTDNDDLVDFGEKFWADKANAGKSKGAEIIAEYVNWNKRRAEAVIRDVYSPKAFLGEFAKGTELKAAFDNYKDSLVKAYYSKTTEEAQKTLDNALKQMKAAGLDDYLKLLKEKNADPKTKVDL
ncbi:ABC transporter [Paenibacillus baekrokdamisoli]|uniref:ABC transporter n=1 Tax=Paenibacillus baekrokdamisoli TaxID=1712516 RepID=A0A3G9JLJ8_9BACL|nr:extracellular solute-binding protein [Paenibacillus baekrokdamisoli]MBB3068953.1 putative aldouronate transport system substrate-binding protein [Paenibacillus baekrokdamisoli]BBH23774.1 ABC transporter [Paenibacillus baekrokdamisoli]